MDKFMGGFGCGIMLSTLGSQSEYNLIVGLIGGLLVIGSFFAPDGSEHKQIRRIK